MVKNKKQNGSESEDSEGEQQMWGREGKDKIIVKEEDWCERFRENGGNQNDQDERIQRYYDMRQSEDIGVQECHKTYNQEDWEFLSNPWDINCLEGQIKNKDMLNNSRQRLLLSITVNENIQNGQKQFIKQMNTNKHNKNIKNNVKNNHNSQNGNGNLLKKRAQQFYHQSELIKKSTSNLLRQILNEMEANYMERNKVQKQFGSLQVAGFVGKLKNEEKTDGNGLYELLLPEITSEDYELDPQIVGAVYEQYNVQRMIESIENQILPKAISEVLKSDQTKTSSTYRVKHRMRNSQRPHRNQKQLQRERLKKHRENQPYDKQFKQQQFNFDKIASSGADESNNDGQMSQYTESNMKNQQNQENDSQISKAENQLYKKARSDQSCYVSQCEQQSQSQLSEKSSSEQDYQNEVNLENNPQKNLQQLLIAQKYACTKDNNLNRSLCLMNQMRKLYKKHKQTLNKYYRNFVQAQSNQYQQNQSLSHQYKSQLKKAIGKINHLPSKKQFIRNLPQTVLENILPFQEVDQIYTKLNQAKNKIQNL